MHHPPALLFCALAAVSAPGTAIARGISDPQPSGLALRRAETRSGTSAGAPRADVPGFSLSSRLRLTVGS